MTAPPRTVGILGGMGPAATVLTMQRIIDSVAAEDDRSHVPLIVDCNTQVPSRIDALIHRTGEDPGPVLVGMARRLQDMGADALAIACNTAHHYVPLIRPAVSIPLLDMVELSVAAAIAQAGPGARVGVLGSPALRMIGLFDRALSAAGLAALHPAEEAPLLAAIRAIKSAGPGDAAAAALDHAARELAGRGADLCLLACTEFSMMAGRVNAPLPVIDTLDVLVRGIHDFAFSGRLAEGADGRRARG